MTLSPQKMRKINDNCYDATMAAVMKSIEKNTKGKFGVDDLFPACLALVAAHAHIRGLFEHLLNLEGGGAAYFNEGIKLLDMAEADIRLAALEEGRTRAEQMFR